MDSGDDSSSDDSCSNTRHQSSYATTPTCAVSPGVGSSDEGKIKNTTTGGGGVEGSVTALLSLKEQQDSNWLDVDYSTDSYVGVKDGVAEDEYQKIKIIEDNSGSHNPKDGQAEYGSRVIDHHADVAEDGP